MYKNTNTTAFSADAVSPPPTRITRMKCLGLDVRPREVKR